MKELVQFYKEWLGFNKYFEIILSNIEKNPAEFNQNTRILEGIEKTIASNPETLFTIEKDHRIDVPVWFGNLNNSRHRIIVFGLEPRDTNSAFNIERVNNLVFGTPFGVDRWNITTTVPRKPQNRYFRVFEELAKRQDTFLLFSDIVKHYKIIDKVNKDRINDQNARTNFNKNASESRYKLQQELRLVNPTHIITLGNDSFNIAKNLLPEYTDIIVGVRHPANGGETIAKEQIKQLMIEN